MVKSKSVIKSWTSLYPEYGTQEDAADLINRVWGVSMEELAEESCDILNNPEKLIKRAEQLTKAEMNPKLEKLKKLYYDKVSMYGFFIPVINYILNEYDEAIENYGYPIENVIESFLGQVTEYTLKTLVLEINSTREKGLLKGNTSEERYKYFEKELLFDTEFVTKLYARYNVLVDIMLRTASDNCKYFLEIFENYEKDKPLISEKLGVSNCGAIKSINAGQGDKHNGKSVAFIEFENGTKLIYKPHSLGTETGFFKLMNWFNSERSHNLLDMKATESADAGDHGWSLIISCNDAESMQDINDFYVRAGQMLCFLYTMNTVDCHFENIISDGAYPILVDCETLFHPHIIGRNSGIGKKVDRIYELMTHHVDTSVLKVGLLPNFIIGGKNNDIRFDISGLGECGDQEFPFRQMKLINEGRDTIRITYDFLKATNTNNCPIYNGKQYSSYRYSKQIKEGFENTFRWILERKNEYQQHIHEFFAGTDIRLLFRATHIYARLLLTSYHPDFLEDSPSRKAILARIGINSDKETRRMVTSEARAMEKGNVPLFTCKIDGKDIYSDDELAWKDYLEKTPLDYADEKIEEMSEDTLYKQSEYISMSFNMTDSNTNIDLTGIHFAGHEETDEGNRSEWIKTAKEIGDYLLSMSIVMNDNGRVHRNWISCTLKGNSESAVDVTPVGYDIYNGSSGVILFLTKLSEITGDEKYINAAKESLNSIYSFFDEIDDNDICSVGMFNGISGYLYAMNEVYSLTRDEECRKYMDITMDVIDKSISSMENYDIIGGIAGCISALTTIYEKADTSKEIKFRCRKMTNDCIEKLKQTAKETKTGGISWKPDYDNKSMTGFAHGNAGIIAVLAKTQRLFGEREDVNKLIEDALKFERMLYNKEEGNWLINDAEPKYGNGWCHGVPGILLEKTELIANEYQENDIYSEYKAALGATVNHSFGIGPSLCHGDLGKLQIVHYAAEVNSDEELKQRCEDKFNEIVKKVIIPRYRGKSFRGTNSAGLMIGTAGFGYTILRMACPERVKMILGA